MAIMVCDCALYFSQLYIKLLTDITTRLPPHQRKRVHTFTLQRNAGQQELLLHRRCQHPSCDRLSHWNCTSLPWILWRARSKRFHRGNAHRRSWLDLVLCHSFYRVLSHLSDLAYSQYALRERAWLRVRADCIRDVDRIQRMGCTER